MTELSVYPSDRPFAGLVLAHGAGAGQRSSFMVLAAKQLAARGVTTATFDFPYITAHRKVPDKTPVLEEAWREALAAAQKDSQFSALPLFIGGKSMGGRMSSHIAAQHAAGIRGVVFFGYPLHPPGRPEQRRDAHLPDVREPMLFVQGSRDTFGTAADLRGMLPKLAAGSAVHEVVDGDHSFKVRVSIAGASQDAVFSEIFDVTAAFIRKHS
jgi:predicted alpha/beta-hydrolase family hydrolase